MFQHTVPWGQCNRRAQINNYWRTPAVKRLVRLKRRRDGLNLQCSAGVMPVKKSSAERSRNGLMKKRAPFDDLYILGLVMQQKSRLVIGMVSVLFCTCSNLSAPVLSGMLLDILVQQQSMEHFLKVFGALSVLYMLEPLVTTLYMNQVVGAGERVVAQMRMEVFRILLMQRVGFFDQHNTMELTARLNQDLDTVRNFVFNNCSRDRGVRAFLEAVGAIIVLFALSWQLAIPCALVIVVTAYSAAIYRHKTKVLEQHQSEASQRMGSVAAQAFDFIRTVRSFAGEALERERFQTHVTQSYRAGRAFGRAKATFEASNRGSVHVSLLVLYAWGGYLVHLGQMPVGVLITGIGFTFSLTYAIQGIVNTLSECRRAASALQRVQRLVQDSNPDPTMYGALPPGAWWEVANGRGAAVQPYGEEAGDDAVLAARRGPFQMRNVNFFYPARPDVQVLKDINLNLPQGTVTALVGRSGAGKSTVVALLSRFYEPSSGVIYLDHRPSWDFSRGEWARAVSLVSQEPVLFSGTLRENIAYGKFGSATEEEVMAAARAANAHEFISKLPDGYDTVVGERGMLLSGGQRQRVAIARALLKDSPIIILDEATSALDVLSERLVQQAVQRLVKGRTVLVIAHRLSTVQNADQIAVMVEGDIVEIGSHDELLSHGGVYCELMSSQEMILGAT